MPCAAFRPGEPAHAPNGTQDAAASPMRLFMCSRRVIPVMAPDCTFIVVLPDELKGVGMSGASFPGAGIGRRRSVCPRYAISIRAQQLGMKGIATWQKSAHATGSWEDRHDRELRSHTS